jgi:transposase-like protein
MPVARDSGGLVATGRREVLRMEVGTSEAEPIWTEFLRKLTRRGLKGVKLAVSDAHEGLKAAATKVLGATWQRCRVGLLKNQSSAELCGSHRQADSKNFPLPEGMSG